MRTKRKSILFPSFISSVLLLIFFTGIAFIGNASEVNLFNIERNRNSDQVIYNVQIRNDGTIDSKKPLHVFWQLNTQNSKTKSLSFIQKKYGYGTNITKELAGEIHFTIAALPSQNFIIKSTHSNSYKAFTCIDGCDVVVNSIYISFVENTVWVPEISYVQINGIDLKTNREFSSMIYP
jgi:hypothetical protein